MLVLCLSSRKSTPESCQRLKLTYVDLSTNSSAYERETKLQPFNDSRMFRNPFDQFHHPPNALSERTDPNWNGLSPLCPEIIRAQRAFADTLKVVMYAREAFAADNQAVLVPYEQSFARYFAPRDSALVWGIFTRLFSAPGEDIATLQHGVGSSRFDTLQAFYNNWPTQYPAGPLNCGMVNNGQPLAGYLTQDLPWTLLPTNGAAMVLCPVIFSTNAQGGNQYPDLSEITCASFGNPLQASRRNMRSIVRVLLHEIMHFNHLFGKDAKPLFIDDWNRLGYPNQDPPDGYGPVNAQIIQQREEDVPIPPSPNVPNPLYNSDNYVFFALEVYFQSVCQFTSGFADPIDQS